MKTSACSGPGVALVEKLGRPLAQAHYVPFTPTAAFPGALVPPSLARLGGPITSRTLVDVGQLPHQEEPDNVLGLVAGWERGLDKQHQ